MRPLHALFVFLAVALVGIGAWWLVGSGERPALETAPPVAMRGAETASNGAAELVAPETAPDRPEPADRIEAVGAEPAPVAAARGAGDAEPGPALRGRVLDADGAPLEGARVLAANRSGLVGLPLDAEAMSSFSWVRLREAETDAAGRFALAGLQAGGVTLAVRSPGHAPLDRRDLALPGSGDLDVGDLALSAGAAVAGRVVDATGSPVAQAEVFRLEPTKSRNMFFFGGGRSGVPVGTTGADGAFLVDELKPGPWRLLVATADHPDAIVTGTADWGRAPEHVEVALEPGYEVHGRVLEIPGEAAEMEVRARPSRDDGHAAGQFTILGDAPDAETRRAAIGPDGRFAIRGLRGGQGYELVAYETGSGGVDQRRSDTVGVRPGDRGVELRYQLESALVFQVVDGKTRQPITEFNVRAGLRFPAPLLDEDGKRRRTHADGRVRFGNLRPRGSNDRASLVIEAVGYEPYEQRDIVLSAEAEVDLGRIELRPVPLLHVTVLDATSGEPVPGARVTLEKIEPDPGGAFGVRIEIEEENGEVVHNSANSRRATTDDEGVALVSTFENADCLLRVRHGDFADHESEPFYVGSSSPGERTVELSPGGTVLVRLLDSAGQAVAGRRIEHRDPEDASGGFGGFFGHGQGHVTDARGEVTFAHLVEGVHSFRPAEDGGPAMFVGDGDADVDFVIQGDGLGLEDDSWSTVAVADEGEHEVVLVAPDELEVYGRVRESGEPLAGAKVELRKRNASQQERMQVMMGGGGKHADTDGDGRYSIQGVKPGDYELIVTHPDRRMPAEFELDVYADERFDAELSVGILEGRITNELGEPVVGARVWAERAQEADSGPRTMMRSVFITADVDTGGGGGVSVSSDPFGQTNDTRTDQDGRYSLRGIQTGVSLVVRVDDDASQPAKSDPVTVGDDQLRGGVDVELAPAGEILVNLNNPDGSPARNLLVIARFADAAEGLDPKTEFVTDGFARLRGLKPGTWSLNLRRMSFGSGGGDEGEPIPDEEIEVVQGENEPVTITLP